MNKEHLGDAFDHWKGSLISLLVRKDLLQNVVVEPMITDSHPWSGKDFETYKRLLGLKEIKEICHKESTFPGGRSEEREDYFNKVPKDGDIFLDPDIGILERAKKEHIKVAEIINLLRSDRVVMVYQHSGQRVKRQEGQTNSTFKRWLLEIKDKLTANENVHCTVYDCGQVAMIFISRKKNRIDQIKDYLQKYLTGTAQRRVWGCGK